MPLSKKRMRERKKQDRLGLTQANVKPTRWFTCELTEDVGCGKPLKERGVTGCVGCSIHQRVKPTGSLIMKGKRIVGVQPKPYIPQIPSVWIDDPELDADGKPIPELT